MNDNNDLNQKLMSVLGSLDKDKIEQVTKMVQNMSSDDLNNIAKMFGINTNKKTFNKPCFYKKRNDYQFKKRLSF